MPHLAAAQLRAFRGLRYAKERVDLASVTSPAPPTDPRHALRLLDDAAAEGDGKDAPLRRAKLKLAEWQRAGIVARDGNASMYAVRRNGDAIGVFAAVAVPDAPSVDGGASTSIGDARFQLGVAVEPVVCAFGEARVKRTLENAVDREADASWKIGEAQYELWCVDDESATARIATLLAQTPLSIEANAALLEAQAAWWKRAHASAASGDDDTRLAGSFALAFLHPADEAWPDVPVGAALLPLIGTLDP